jgi:hypothetical protein
MIIRIFKRMSKDKRHHTITMEEAVMMKMKMKRKLIPMKPCSMIINSRATKMRLSTMSLRKV